MASRKRAQLSAIVDCNDGEGGLEEFEPEQERAASPTERSVWVRVPIASSPPPLPVTDGPRARPSLPLWPLGVAALVAAMAAWALLSWVSLDSDGWLLPVTPPETVRSSGSAVTQSPAGAPAAPEPVTHDDAPAADAVATEPSPPSPPSPAAPSPSPSAPLDPDLERALAALSSAYRSLDAAAVAAVWPGADVEKLAGAFSALKYQALTFDRCSTRQRSAASVVVSCDVSIAAAARSGDQTLQRRQEAWTLVLDRSGDRPMVAGLSVR